MYSLNEQHQIGNGKRSFKPSNSLNTTKRIRLSCETVFLKIKYVLAEKTRRNFFSNRNYFQREHATYYQNIHQNVCLNFQTSIFKLDETMMMLTAKQHKKATKIKR